MCGDAKLYLLTQNKKIHSKCPNPQYADWDIVELSKITD